MREGNVRLELTVVRKVNDKFGQQIIRKEKSYYVYALRQDRGGREDVYGDTRAGIWQTRFTIRATPGVEKDLNEECYFTDSRGNRHTIEAISFAPQLGANRFLWVYCFRTEEIGS